MAAFYIRFLSGSSAGGGPSAEGYLRQEVPRLW